MKPEITIQEERRRYMTEIENQNDELRYMLSILRQHHTTWVGTDENILRFTIDRFFEKNPQPPVNPMDHA